MNFDAKTLLTTPPMTVDTLAAKLATFSAMGMGAAEVRMPDGQPIAAVELVAAGEVPAHFVFRPKALS